MRKNSRAVMFFLGIVVSRLALFSQPAGDTLFLAQNRIQQKKIKQAYRLLHTYQASHSTDLNATWLLAVTAYWTHHLKQSRELYQKAIQDHPENYDLQLDYGKILVDMGQYRLADPFLKRYLTYDPTNAQALVALARTTFWEGDFRQAETDVQTIVSQHPQDQPAIDLFQEIRLARSPWIQIATGFYFDNQPLQYLDVGVETGMYLHPLADLHLFFHAPLFQPFQQLSDALWLQAGNTFHWNQTGWKLTVEAGAIQFPYRNHFDWTGNLAISKTFARHLECTAQADRSPYFSTLKSIDTVVIQNHLTGSVGWNESSYWNGQAAFHWFQYPCDGNQIFTASAWIQSLPLKFSFGEVRFGYSYSFSNALENRFTPEKSLQEILIGYDSTQSIKGIYDPYFTPDDQHIHSALLSVTLHPGKKIDAGISGNIGFYAVARMPYFYLDKDSEGQVVIVRGFMKENYWPYGVDAFVAFRLSDKIRLKATYGLHSTWYYRDQSVGLSMKINLVNGKK